MERKLMAEGVRQRKKAGTIVFDFSPVEEPPMEYIFLENREQQTIEKTEDKVEEVTDIFAELGLARKILTSQILTFRVMSSFPPKSCWMR